MSKWLACNEKKWSVFFGQFFSLIHFFPLWICFSLFFESFDLPWIMANSFGWKCMFFSIHGDAWNKWTAEARIFLFHKWRQSEWTYSRLTHSWCPYFSPKYCYWLCPWRPLLFLLRSMLYLPLLCWMLVMYNLLCDCYVILLFLALNWTLWILKTDWKSFATVYPIVWSLWMFFFCCINQFRMFIMFNVVIVCLDFVDALTWIYIFRICKQTF